MKCPVCGREMFRVYFGYEAMMWRCMECERLYQFYECRHQDGELTRVAVWRREKQKGKEDRRLSSPG